MNKLKNSVSYIHFTLYITLYIYCTYISSHYIRLREPSAICYDLYRFVVLPPNSLLSSYIQAGCKDAYHHPRTAPDQSKKSWMKNKKICWLHYLKRKTIILNQNWQLLIRYMEFLHKSSVILWAKAQKYIAIEDNGRCTYGPKIDPRLEPTYWLEIPNFVLILEY